MLPPHVHLFCNARCFLPLWSLKVWWLEQVMRKPDYFNIARLLGLRHLEYVSPGNATLLRDSTTNALVDWNHVNFVGSVPIDIQHLTVGSSSWCIQSNIGAAAVANETLCSRNPSTPSVQLLQLSLCVHRRRRDTPFFAVQDGRLT